MNKHPEGGEGVEVRKPFEEGFAPDTTMDSLHKPRGARTECDGCERRRECVPVGEEVLCAECILARTVDHERATTTQKPDEEPEGDWPVVFLVRRPAYSSFPVQHTNGRELAEAYVCKFNGDSIPPDAGRDIEKYYPASHPALLSPEDCSLIDRGTSGGLDDAEQLRYEQLLDRLATYAQKGANDGNQ